MRAQRPEADAVRQGRSATPRRNRKCPPGISGEHIRMEPQPPLTGICRDRLGLMLARVGQGMLELLRF
jgi:hypothetical protein